MVDCTEARTESLGLEEEVGRWEERGIGCRVCGAVVEDSWHVLAECVGYEKLREEWAGLTGVGGGEEVARWALCWGGMEEGLKVEERVEKAANFIKSILDSRTQLLLSDKLPLVSACRHSSA